MVEYGVKITDWHKNRELRSGPDLLVTFCVSLWKLLGIHVHFSDVPCTATTQMCCRVQMRPWM